MSRLYAASSIKMLRETLCVAQTYIGVSNDPRRVEHLERLQELINSCDEQRILGQDGKHGSKHTGTCGCIDD